MPRRKECREPGHVELHGVRPRAVLGRGLEELPGLPPWVHRPGPGHLGLRRVRGRHLRPAGRRHRVHHVPHGPVPGGHGPARVHRLRGGHLRRFERVLRVPIVRGRDHPAGHGIHQLPQVQPGAVPVRHRRLRVLRVRGGHLRCEARGLFLPLLPRVDVRPRRIHCVRPLRQELLFGPLRAVRGAVPQVPRRHHLRRERGQRPSQP
mmetsp:Transcript_58977/g.133550  ORF Transcript_58977/g.133550 Transcript_58977/m.133550 type:complete len:206 (-) Transcript_58977:2382-2999(-)